MITILLEERRTIMLKIAIGIVEGVILIALFVIPWNAATCHFDEKAKKFTAKGRKMLLAELCLFVLFMGSFLVFFPMLKDMI